MNTKKAPKGTKGWVLRLLELEGGKKQVDAAQMTEVLSKFRKLARQHPIAALSWLFGKK